MSFDASGELSKFHDKPFPDFMVYWNALSDDDKKKLIAEVKVRLSGAGNDPSKVVPYGATLLLLVGLDVPIVGPTVEPPPAAVPQVTQASTSTTLPVPLPVAVTAATPSPIVETVSEDELKAMWDEVDALSVDSIDKESLRIFEYQGFSPDAIMRSLIIAKKTHKIEHAVFMEDILKLCSLAVIKGSINDNNIKKISAEGVAEITKLEQRYGIKRGSGRSESADKVTVSRIAATFPGKVIQLITQDKVGGRKFVGPLRSHTLPSAMRHQAFAAVIPSSLKEAIKEYLLTLVTAFSVDQSLCINPDKKTKLDVLSTFETQRNFIQITADNKYPPEHVRQEIFKKITLNYDDLLICARAIQQINPSFKIIDRVEFVEGTTLA